MNLMILDGNSIINRAFFGVRTLNAPDGTPTNAVFGFLNILFRLTEEYKPDALAVAFDLKAPTFRHKAYEGYKAKRKGMPEELAVQVPILKEILDNMNITRLELEGYEADDILGTVSQKCDNAGTRCIVVTGDKDSLQLVSDNTSVCLIKTKMGSTETLLYTPEVFSEEYGFEPRHLIDLKALMGDTSDNIPGVPGVGEKTALTLIQKYKDIDRLFADYEGDPDIKTGAKNKLSEGKESAGLSYFLASIVRDAPLDFDISDAGPMSFSPELYPMLKRLGFSKLISKLQLEPSDDVSLSGEAENIDYIKITPDNDFDFDAFAGEVGRAELVAVEAGSTPDEITVAVGTTEYSFSWSSCGDIFNRVLKTVFSPDVRKLSFSIKDLMRLLISEGLSTDGFVFDFALAGYMLDCLHGEYDSEYLARKFLGRGWAGLCDAFELYGRMNAELKDRGMDELYYSAELPLCAVLANMEDAGFRVDRKALHEFGQYLNLKIEESRSNIFSVSGYEFNINSPKQLGKFLFDDLMLPEGKKRSTNAEVLEGLRPKHPVIDEILEYRMLTKLKSTYADGLLAVISSDGRIHTSFQMTVTATGRLSSTEPNLQNIPIRKQLGSEIRKMFIPSPGNILVDADYSQIELRLLAHMSGDEAMIDAFNSGEDFHTGTAAYMFNVPVSEVTPEMRRGAKAVNFGVVYGISAFSLSRDINVSVASAKGYMEAYYSRFSGVDAYMKKTISDAASNGFVSTLYGRQRPMPELKNSNFNVRSFGERVARNMPIQGTAADVIKLAMVAVDRRFREDSLKARLLLQVHDELIVECPTEEKQIVEDILKQEMESVISLRVPLSVEVESGLSWAEAH